MTTIENINPVLSYESDEKDFCKIYRRYKDMIERKAFYLTNSRQDVEDISQELFLKLWLKWPQIKLLTNDSLEAYIYAMIRNHIINIHRKTNLVRRHLKSYEAMRCESYWHDEVIVKEGLKVYHEAVKKLPPKQKQVYLLYDNNLESFEIAASLHRSKNTINNQLSSAYKIVKRHIKQELKLSICENGRRRVCKMAA